MGGVVYVVAFVFKHTFEPFKASSGPPSFRPPMSLFFFFGLVWFLYIGKGIEHFHHFASYRYQKARMQLQKDKWGNP